MPRHTHRLHQPATHRPTFCHATTEAPAPAGPDAPSPPTHTFAAETEDLVVATEALPGPVQRWLLRAIYAVVRAAERGVDVMQRH